MTDEDPSTKKDSNLDSTDSLTENNTTAESIHFPGHTVAPEHLHSPENQQWIVAREYLKSIGEPSALFTGCSRSLIDCTETNNGRLSKFAATQLTRLLRSPSMLSQVFYAAKTYYAKDITSRGTVEAADFAFFMQPYEIATIITVGYSTHRIAKLLDKNDWEVLWKPYQCYCDLSMPLGFAIPVIGPTRALMTAAGKFLGWGLFNYKNPEQFKKYRVASKMQKRSFNLDEEIALFGTTHLHIASLIWQRFGYGITTSEDYFWGLTEIPINKLSPGAVKFKVARLWLESLLENGVPPSQNVGDDYDLEDDLADKLLETLESINKNGSEFKWLLRNRDDIGVEKTPDLITDFEEMKKAIKKHKRNSEDSTSNDKVDEK